MLFLMRTSPRIQNSIHNYYTIMSNKFQPDFRYIYTISKKKTATCVTVIISYYNNE